MWSVDAAGNSASIKTQLDAQHEIIEDEKAKEELGAVKDALITIAERASGRVILSASGSSNYDKDGKRLGGSITVHING